MIENVTKRASKAIYDLSIAKDKFQTLMFDLRLNEYDDECLNLILDGLAKIEEAQQELVKILAQDNRIEIKP